MASLQPANKSFPNSLFGNACLFRPYGAHDSRRDGWGNQIPDFRNPAGAAKAPEDEQLVRLV
ncbi:MAG: hypothetical protein WC647_19540 [Desulfomonilaceae bacterium]